MAAMSARAGKVAKARMSAAMAPSISDDGPRPAKGKIGIGRKAFPHHDWLPRFRAGYRRLADPDFSAGRPRPRHWRSAAASANARRVPWRPPHPRASENCRQSWPSLTFATSAARSTPPSGEKEAQADRSAARSASASGRVTRDARPSAHGGGDIIASTPTLKRLHCPRGVGGIGARRKGPPGRPRAPGGRRRVE